jgi:coproporphyrinogen III oxidase-like Fe-S oxidoreductase
VLTKTFMSIWMSVQSMTEGVLKNIKRRNISVNTMFNLQEQMVGSSQGTLSEVILCLPGETYQSHMKSLTELIRLGLNQINTYQLMLLHGSEMKLDDQTHNKHGYVKRYRILPRSFTELPQIAVPSRSRRSSSPPTRCRSRSTSRCGRST